MGLHQESRLLQCCPPNLLPLLAQNLQKLEMHVYIIQVDINPEAM